MASKEENKPRCKFGEDCYRKNPQHLKNYRHPKRKHDSVNLIKHLRLFLQSSSTNMAEYI